MSQPGPRIPPLPPEEWTDQAREVFAFWGEPGAWENGSKIEKEMVMAQHPSLALDFHRFGKPLLMDSSIPERPRELMVLRGAWRNKGRYAWHFHVGYALKAGLTREEILAIKDGPDAAIWAGNLEDISVLRLVDELIDTATVSDQTWATLETFYDRKQMMELVFTVGAYTLLNWSVNAFGIGFGKDIDALDFDLKTVSGKDPLIRDRPGESEDWADSGN